MSREEPPASGVNSPLLHSLFDSLRWVSFSLAVHLCFSQDITKWCKIYTKTNSWFQKLHEEFGQLQTSSGKSKKLKFDGLLLSKNHIPSAKTWYKEDLLNLLSTTCSPNSLYHFWNHFSQHNSYIFFSSNIIYFRQN